ncbi:hypothetical protein ACQ4PT_005605 [Festuca glaucescens]
MGSSFSRDGQVATKMRELSGRFSAIGDQFPGSGYRPANRKTWMAELGREKLRVDQVVWPGSHNSATNDIGDIGLVLPVARPFAQCQRLSVYEQLTMGCRLLDIRVQKDRLVCHEWVTSYSVDVVLADVKRFLAETVSEVVVLEIRTEYKHQDPPGFGAYLEGQLGEHLIPQDEAVFHKTIAELLPRRLICFWKPHNPPAPGPGGLLWSSQYLKDNWTNTDLPKTKFDKNMGYLAEQPDTVAGRNYLYRVENTLTAQTDNLTLAVEPVTRRMHGYARLFIKEVFANGHGDKLQVFSTDFIYPDFVDACFGVTKARVHGDA